MFRNLSVKAGAAGAALAAAAVTAVVPAVANAAVTGAFTYPTVTVHLAQESVAAPGGLAATLDTSACVTRVSAYAVNERTGTLLPSTIAGGSGQRFQVIFRVPQGTVPGPYQLAGVFGRPCADKSGTGAQDDPIRISLARLRQLAVHETGHALGFAHNFAGSTYGDRASVMDYPPPRVRIAGDQLDFSDAYKVGVGDWDRFAVKWLYSDAPATPAGQAALEAIVRQGYAQGLRYVRDEDARPTGSAHPDGALWDDGPDAIAGLAHVLQVRSLALSRFGPGNIAAGAPLSELRRVVVPVYLFHR